MMDVLKHKEIVMSFAQAFTPVAVSKVEELIQEGNKVILFVGRPSCPYCQRFEPKLTAVANETGADILFVNSENLQEIEAIQAFRATYGILTVPGLLVANGGAVKVVCDSSLSEAAIAEFIG